LHYDVLIAGGGAAGLMCAIEAGKRGRRVAVLEHSDRPGKKILISGGGRCNFTNRQVAADNFLCANRHFVKSALARYQPQDFIALVKRHGIAHHEKALGQLFCDDSASAILRMLEDECRRAGASILCDTQISAVRRSERFLLETNRGNLEADALVVATGGLSIPKMGATDLGYRLARQFGVKVQSPYPALVPLVLNEQDRKNWCDLAGVSLEVIARVGRAAFREKLLITHRGLSGPAILQISSYWKTGEAILLDLSVAPMPRRFAKRWSELGETKLEWRLVPEGTEGFAKAEVTAGGVDTHELDSRTMQCRSVPGLYFIGEVVDVTGWLGGYNFQWAWASGFAAGQAV